MDIMTPANRGYAAHTLEILDIVGDKWSLLVIYLLGEQPLRFAELRRQASPVSPKMLTQTLRGLARFGMVRRTVIGTMPPSVEYALTDLGRSFLTAAYVICNWVKDNLDALGEASRAFDDQGG